MSDQTTNTRKYINGVFLRKVWEDIPRGGILIGQGINKEEYLKEIQAIPADDRGFINLTIGTQRNDTSKLSLWLDDRPRPSVDNNYKKPGDERTSPNDTDDLPF